MNRPLLLLITVMLLAGVAACEEEHIEDEPLIEVQESQEQVNPADVNGDGRVIYGFATPYDPKQFSDFGHGFEYAAHIAGIEAITTYAQFNENTELKNIEYLIEQNIDGICIMPFNSDNLSAMLEMCEDANVPVVVSNSLGEGLKTRADIVACVDIDYEMLGATLGQYVDEQYMNESIAEIIGVKQAEHSKQLIRGFESHIYFLNKVIATREAHNDAIRAGYVFTEMAEDYGNIEKKRLDFSVLFVETDTMASSVVSEIELNGLDNLVNVITVISTEEGIQLLKTGRIDYAVSINVGLQEMVSLLALHAHNMKLTTTLNQKILMPVIPVTNDNVDMVSRKPKPEWLTIIQEYFPLYAQLIDESAIVEPA